MHECRCTNLHFDRRKIFSSIKVRLPGNNKVEKRKKGGAVKTELKGGLKPIYTATVDHTTKEK